MSVSTVGASERTRDGELDDELELDEGSGSKAKKSSDAMVSVPWTVDD